MNTEWGEIPPNTKNTARVVSCNREQYRIAKGTEVLQAVVKGRLRHEAKEAAELPVIGDWVEFEQSGDLAVITGVLPRKSVISRKIAGATTEEQPIASNIDTVGIVMGLDGGRNFNVRALERYLTLAWNSGAVPVVVLNKADLAEDAEDYRGEAETAAPGVDILVTSALGGTGIEELRSLIGPGRTAVLIGPSGVGKSALTNALLGESAARTNETRRGDKRGRHTTTNAAMYRIPGGGLLIDAPGLKELQLWGDTEGVDAVFEEIAEFASECRFADCAHDGEPGCAVQDALQNGNLSEERFLSYLDLRKELEYLAYKTGERAKLQEHARNRKFGKMIKDMKKHHHKYNS